MMFSFTNADFARSLGNLKQGLRELGFAVEVDRGADGAGAFAVGEPGQPQIAQIDRADTVGLVRNGFALGTALESDKDAVAFALYLNRIGDDPTAVAGDDRLVGLAIADGAGKAEGRGVSVGTNEFLDPDEPDAGDEDEDEDDGGPPGPEDFIPIVEAVVSLGDGDDEVAGQALVTADPGTVEMVFAAANAVIVDRDSVLLLGAGDDRIAGSTRLDVIGGPVGAGDPADTDLEVIGDAIENVGLIDAGDGDDIISADTRVVSTSGATAIGDGIDNSSVGNPNPVAGEQEGGTRFLLGAGNDAVDSRARVRSEGDAAIANGLDTRSLFDLGDGDDTVDLVARAEFVDTAAGVGQQEEAIADGLENRGTVLFGEGDDRLSARGEAIGNGVLTTADGIDSRGNPAINPDPDGPRGIAIDAGAGDDHIAGAARAVATAPVSPSEDAGQKPAKTLAYGMLIENGDAATVLAGDGADRLVLTATAEGLATDTAAFGLAGISIDIPNTSVRTLLDTGAGDDAIDARATAHGDGAVAAYGIFGGETRTGDGADRVVAEGVATSGANAQATGIRLDDDFDLFGGTDADNTPIVSEEGALLHTGSGADEVTGIARLGAAVEDGSAFGIFLGEGGSLTTGDGADRVTGEAVGAVGTVRAIAGDAAGILDTGDDDDTVDAARGGFGGGFTLRLGEGDDVARGFGDVVIDGGGGQDRLEVDFSLAELAASGGEIITDDPAGAEIVLAAFDRRLEANGIETFAFTDGPIAAEDLAAAFDDALVA